MAITKRIENDKIEIVNTWSLQVRTATIIEEDTVELSRSFHRHCLEPFSSSKDADGKWTHTDTDISSEDETVKAVCNAVWTDTVKANYKTFVESQES